MFAIVRDRLQEHPIIICYQHQLQVTFDPDVMIIITKPPSLGFLVWFFQVNLAGLCDVVNMAERYCVKSLVYVPWNCSKGFHEVT